MAKLGTPENPEILDPSRPGESFNGQERVRDTGSHTGAASTKLGLRARLKLVRQIAVWLMSAALPALLFDTIFISLIRSAAESGSAFVWLGAILFFFPAFIFSLVAIAALLLLLPILVLALSGKRAGVMGGLGGPGGFRMGSFDARIFRTGFGAPGRGVSHEPRDVTDSGSPRVDGFFKE